LAIAFGGCGGPQAGQSRDTSKKSPMSKHHTLIVFTKCKLSTTITKTEMGLGWGEGLIPLWYKKKTNLHKLTTSETTESFPNARPRVCALILLLSQIIDRKQENKTVIKTGNKLSSLQGCVGVPSPYSLSFFFGAEIFFASLYSPNISSMLSFHLAYGLSSCIITN